MASTAKKRLRSDDVDVFLVGKCDNEILGAKLPSMKQVLQVFFYQMRIVKSNVIQSARFAIDLVIPLWEKARIPVQTKPNCVKRLVKLYDEWNALKKNINAEFEVYRKRESEFREKIDNFIFDIATPDALLSMKIPEDKDFLIQQRQKGRPGSMLGVDQKLAHKEKSQQERMERQNNFKQKHLELTASGRENTRHYDRTANNNL